MHSSIFLILGYNFAIYLCIFRSIKLPSVQQAVSHTKPVQTSYTRGKSTRGCGSIARGHTRSSATRGTLKEIKEAVTKKKKKFFHQTRKHWMRMMKKKIRLKKGKKRTKKMNHKAGKIRLPDEEGPLHVEAEYVKKYK